MNTRPRRRAARLHTTRLNGSTTPCFLFTVERAPPHAPEPRLNSGAELPMGLPRDLGQRSSDMSTFLDHLVPSTNQTAPLASRPCPATLLRHKFAQTHSAPEATWASTLDQPALVVKGALCRHDRHWNSMPGVPCGKSYPDAHNGYEQPISLHVVSSCIPIKPGRLRKNSVHTQNAVRIFPMALTSTQSQDAQKGCPARPQRAKRRSVRFGTLSL